MWISVHDHLHASWRREEALKCLINLFFVSLLYGMLLITKLAVPYRFLVTIASSSVASLPISGTHDNQIGSLSLLRILGHWLGTCTILDGAFLLAVYLENSFVNSEPLFHFRNGKFSTVSPIVLLHGALSFWASHVKIGWLGLLLSCTAVSFPSR